MPFPGRDYIYEKNAKWEIALAECVIGTWLIRESTEEGVLCVSQLGFRDEKTIIESVRFYFNGVSWSNKKGEQFQLVSKSTITQGQYNSFLSYIIKDKNKGFYTGIPYNCEVLEKARELCKELGMIIDDMESKRRVEQPCLPYKKISVEDFNRLTISSNFNNNSLPSVPSSDNYENNRLNIVRQ